jgi:hypothetical protein
MQCRRQQIGQRVKDENILWRENILASVFDVQHPEQRFGVGDRNAKHGAGIRQNAGQMSGECMLHQCAFASSGYASQNACPQRNALARCVSGSSGLGLDLNLFGSVVEQTDADVIETEVLLNLPGDLAQHVNRIIAGNRCA